MPAGLSPRKFALDGVPLDLALPAEWAPLAGEMPLGSATEQKLSAAWIAYTVATTPAGERPQLWLNQWPLLLYALRAAGLIELAGRDRPSLDAELKPIRMPRVEWCEERFSLDARYGELRHVSGAVWYDLHVRMTPAQLASVSTPRAPEPAPTPIPLALKKRDRLTDRAVTVVFEAMSADGLEKVKGMSADERATRYNASVTTAALAYRRLRRPWPIKDDD